MIAYAYTLFLVICVAILGESMYISFLRIPWMNALFTSSWYSGRLAASDNNMWIVWRLATGAKFSS